MEALTGATVAALTIYDMCKALSHDIRIERVRLLSKSGGKRTCVRRVVRKRTRCMSAPQLYGLVLTGGRSRRMQRDKAGLRIRRQVAAGARHGIARRRW